MARFLGKRRVQRDKVRGGEQFIELFHQLDLQTARPRDGKVWIERQHAHSKGNGASAKLAPDPAHANNAEGLVVELNALQIFPVPSAALQRGVGARDIPGKTE